MYTWTKSELSTISMVARAMCFPQLCASKIITGRRNASTQVELSLIYHSNTISPSTGILNDHQQSTKAFERVGIYLPQSVFSHGQLYVAFSRARAMSDVYVKVVDTDCWAGRQDCYQECLQGVESMKSNPNAVSGISPRLEHLAHLKLSTWQHLANSHDTALPSTENKLDLVSDSSLTEGKPQLPVESEATDGEWSGWEMVDNSDEVNPPSHHFICTILWTLSGRG